MTRIAIGVHGRFSAFATARGLLERDQDVHLFTNYPRRVVQQFGFPAAHTKSLVIHGVAARVVGRVFRGNMPARADAALRRMFGAWLARQIREREYDAVLCWSGVAEETFRRTESTKLLNRSSLHIAAQRSLLQQEAERVGRHIDMPSQWDVEREEREYALADAIVVPSEAARRSFAGSPLEARAVAVPLTASASRWRPSADAIEARRRRLSSRQRLRVLYVGNISYQKGMHDLAMAVRSLHDRMDFRFTGFVMPECRELVRELSNRAHFDGHVSEASLNEIYNWADVFVLPSIQDGFGVVLAQAQAAGLPFIASENTGGPDLLTLGGRGWIVPIRAAERLIGRLQSLDDDRAPLLESAAHLIANPITRTWSDVAQDIIKCCIVGTANT